MPESVVLSLASDQCDAAHPAESYAVDEAWTKRMPTGMEAAEPPSKSYRHDEVSLTFKVNTPSVLTLVDSPEGSNEIVEQLEDGSPAQRQKVLLWLHDSWRPLALSKLGCRIVQKALDVAGACDRDLIIGELKENIVELYESPWGNHVLSRAIEVLPAAKNSFVISALLGRGATVSKHRFGCRIVCRLIEHCTEEQIGGLLDEILEQADVLARHAFGNFVVQSAFEHALATRRAAMLATLLPDFASLAKHRTGSLVVQRALDYCDAEGQELGIQALLNAGGENSLLEVAGSHYGSYVIEQLAGLCHERGSVQKVGQILANNLQQLQVSDHAQRVIAAFGLATIDPAADA